MGKRPRQLRWMIPVLAGAGLVMAGYFFVQDRVVDGQLQPLIQQKMSDLLHSPVTLGSVQADLRGGLELQDLAFEVPAGGVSLRILAQKVSARLSLVDWLWRHKSLQDSLDSLTVTQPKVFIQPASGPVSTPAGAATAAAAPPGAFPLLPFKKIFVRGGEVYFQARGEKEGKPVAQAIHVQAFSDDAHRWGIWVEAKPPESKDPGALLLTGSVNLDEAKVVGKVQLGDWNLASVGTLMRGLTGWDIPGGRASVEVPFAWRPGRSFWYDLRGHVQDASLKTPGADGVLFSGIEGRTAIRPSGFTLSQPLKFQIGQTPWQASGVIPFDGRPVSLTTSSDSLYLATLFNDVLRMKDLPVQGTGRAALTVTGSLSSPLMQGSAELGPSQVGAWKLDSLALAGRYVDGALELSQIEGRLYGGSLNGGGQIRLGEGQPVSLHTTLERVQAKEVAATLGMNGLEGVLDAEVNLGGTLQKPVFTSTSSMDLVRSLRNTLHHYSVKNDIQLKDHKLVLSVDLSDETTLESHLVGEFNETDGGYEFGKLSMTNGKRTVKFQGQGSFPKAGDQAFRLEVRGQDIALQDLVFFKDQFPEVSGKVGLDLVLNGTRMAPRGSLQFQSPDVVLGKGQTPGPLSVSLDWAEDHLLIHQLDYRNSTGLNFSIVGDLGLLPDSPLDLKIQSSQMPLPLLAEITNLNNLPQPFAGLVTGKIHFGGIRKNPIVEGEGRVTGLQAADWWADSVDALITSDKGKVQVQKVEVAQGANGLSVSGSWDTAASPARMALRFSAKHFQLAKGPTLTGDFNWQAQTGGPWWADWKGVFASPLFSLEDGPKTLCRFTDFTTNASFKDSVLKGSVALGKDIGGEASLDFSGPQPQLEADLRIDPVLLADAPSLSQFLPGDLKASGLLAGEIKVLKGPLDRLPLEGHFTVADGKIANYLFDKFKVDFSGDRTQIKANLSLARDAATYNLSGQLQAPAPAAGQPLGSFWVPEGRISLNGPLTKEKLSNLLSLLNVDASSHRVGGTVDGNFSLSGTLGQPTLKFDLQGTDLVFDDNRAPTADLHFAWAQGKLSVGASHLSLPKGQINIDQGTVALDPQDPSLLSIDLSGSSRNLPIALFNLSSQVHMAGQLALADKPNRPTFAGTLSLKDSGAVSTGLPSQFDLSMSVNHSHIVFKPQDSPNPQLAGELDLSQAPKILFNNLRLLHSKGSFQLDGTLDPDGPCQITSDAERIPIEEIGKWFFPDFPLSGNGNFHLLLQGTLANPVFNTSFSITGGQYAGLKFDLLSGDLRSKENTLLLGSEEVPLTISKKGLYSFNVHGSVPFTFSPSNWAKIKNQEMSVDAEMDKGDFSLIMLTGLVQKASGAMDFSAHVGGTLDDPVLNLDLDLSKASLVPGQFAHSVDDLNGRIKVRDNHVAVDDLNALVGHDRIFIWT
ncbi:MAG TPA: hypothetical protein VMU88_05435, partial [bacterium]|nr:hypothetical protein [bacterium]